MICSRRAPPGARTCKSCKVSNSTMGILYLPMLGVGVGQGDVMQWEGVDEYVWTILNDDEDAHGLELFVDDRRLHFGAACCGDGLHVACVRAVENSSSGLGCRTGGDR